MAVDIPLFNKNKPIVYVSSPLINIDAVQTSSNDYFVQLITFIVQKIHHSLGADVVVRLSKSTTSADQVTLIEELFSQNEKYSGVILSPVNVSHVALVLQSLIHTLDDYKSLPIITIDKKITEPVHDILIPSITSNWRDGGACAAKLILRRLSVKDDNEAKNILYMPGLEGSAERIAGFTDVLGGDANSRFTLTRLPSADFTRETAKTRFIDYLKTNRNVVDFIFACNDEMALGIKDAIVEARQSNQLVQRTKVIGFDGTKEFTAAMDAENNDILLATVDVNLESQVNKLVEKLPDLFSATKEYDRPEHFSHSEGYRPREARQFETM